MDLFGQNDTGIGRFEDLYERNFQQPFMQVNNSAVVSSRGDENFMDHEPHRHNYQQQPYDRESNRQ